MKKTALSAPDRALIGPPLKPAGARPAGYWTGLAVILVLTLLAWTARGRLFPSRGAAPAAPAGTAPLDPTEARLREAVDRQPRAAAPHAALGRYALSVARPVTALWELETARSLQSQDDPALRLEQAQAIARMGRRDLAIAELRSVIASHPRETSVRTQLAELLLSAGRAGDAVAVLRPAVSVLPVDADALLLLGRGYHALGRLTEAQAVLERYAALAPATEPRDEPLARFLLAMGRPEEARRALMRDKRVAFRTGEFHYLVGLTYLQDQAHPNPDRAGAALTYALHFDPKHAPAQAAVGQMLEQRGAREQAEAQYEAAIQTNPTLPEPHLRLARLLISQGRAVPGLQHRGIAATLQDRLPEAKAAFQQMLTAGPGDLDAIQSFILTCVAMKRVDLARPGVEALQRRPFDPADADRVSKLYLITGARQPCRELARLWRERSPKAAAPLRLLGGLTVDDLRVSEGIKLYEEAWAAEPDQAETAIALGNAWARVPTRANLERARDWLQRAVALAPDVASHRDSLGRVLEQLGRTQEAEAAYLEALDRDPSLSSAASGLVRLAQRTNQPAAARLFGRVVRAMDDGKRAEDAVRRRLWDRPDDPEAQFAAAQRLACAGEYVKADNHLQQVLQRKPEWPAARSLRRTVEALEVWSER